MNFNFESFNLIGLTGPLLLLPWILVHVFFAIGVYRDTKKMKRIELVGPVIWTLATLIGGVFVATAYWLLNRSILNSNAESNIRNRKSGLSPSDDL